MGVLVARPPQRPGQARGASDGRGGPGAGMAPRPAQEEVANPPSRVCGQAHDTGAPAATQGPGSHCSLSRLEAE